MQEKPIKTQMNNNEVGQIIWHDLQHENAEREVQHTKEQQKIIESALDMVACKINEILGDDNELIAGHVVLPEVRLLATDPEHPNCAGYFSASTSTITLIMDKIRDEDASTKVLVHELIHFFSHNGRDDFEGFDIDVSIATRNNVGFRRNFGVDIREGNEFGQTSDYFLSFNEAVTEQMAIDIFPGVHETYADYRGLLGQVIDDACAREFGTMDKSGVYQKWSKEQVKQYIYRCFFKGDLDGFSAFLSTVYEEYDISEQQFGLMTHRDDLPTTIVRAWTEQNGGTPPDAAQVVTVIQQRLNHKTPTDYVSDINLYDEDSGPYGVEYDNFLTENELEQTSTTAVDGKMYDIDNHGLVIYRGEDAFIRLRRAIEECAKLFVELRNNTISKTDLEESIDHLVFEVYHMSMLSDGFRQFYVYKHSRLDEVK